MRIIDPLRRLRAFNIASQATKESAPRVCVFRKVLRHTGLSHLREWSSPDLKLSL